MKPGDERHDTTTPSASSADESERVPAASSTAVPATSADTLADTQVKTQTDHQGEPPNESASERDDTDSAPTREIGGRKGPEPARYGDWEKNGRCIDF